MNPVRLNITVPATGVYELRDIAGYGLYVFDGPNTAGDFAGVPTAHFDSVNGDGVPLHRGAALRHWCGWRRLFVRGNGTSGTLTLLVFQKPFEVCGPILSGVDAVSTVFAPENALIDVNQGDVGSHVFSLEGAPNTTKILASRAVGAAYDPVGRWVYYCQSSGTPGVYRMRTDGTQAELWSAETLVNGNALRQAVRIDHVNRRLVVTVGTASGPTAGGLITYDLDTGAVLGKLQKTDITGGDAEGYYRCCCNADNIFAITKTVTVPDKYGVHVFDWDANFVRTAFFESDPATTTPRGYKAVEVDADWIYVTYYGRVHRRAISSNGAIVDRNSTGSIFYVFDHGGDFSVTNIVRNAATGEFWLSGGDSTIGQGAIWKVSSDWATVTRVLNESDSGVAPAAPGDIASLTLTH